MIIYEKCPKCSEPIKPYGKGSLVCGCNRAELEKRDYENQGKRD